MYTPGYLAIMNEIKTDVGMNRDQGLSVWDSNMCWLFALADYMFYWVGETMEGYTPSPIRFDVDTALLESPELATLGDLDFNDQDVRDVYAVIYRYDTWLRMAGENY